MLVYNRVAVCLLLVMWSTVSSVEAAAIRGRVTTVGTLPIDLDAQLLPQKASTASVCLARAAIAADGTWSLPTVSGEEFAVLLRAGDTCWWARSHVKPGTDLGELTLPAVGQLTGSVVDRAGTPLAGVTLRLSLKHDNTCAHWTVAQSMVTDAVGGFTCPVAQGVWGITPIGEAWAPVLQEVTVGSGKPIPVTVIAQPAATISGTVRDPAGQPVAEALIVTRTGDQETRSDAQGRFRLTGLTAGTIALRVTAAGLALAANAPVELETRLGETVERVVTLAHTGTVAIRVRCPDPAAALPPQVTVILEHTGSGGYDRRDVPLVDGLARLTELAVGTYTAKVSAPETGTATAEVTIIAQAETAIEVILPRVYTYRGTVTDVDGQPVSGLVVSGGVEERLSEHTTTITSHNAEVDAQGRFQFTGLVAGTVLNLSLSSTGLVPQKHRIAITEQGASDGIFRLERGLTGRFLIRDADGQLLSKVRIALQAPSGGISWSAETGDDGTATIEGLTTDLLELSLSHDEHVTLRTTWSVPVDGKPEERSLDAGEILTGRVLDAQGQPQVAAQLRVRREQHSQWDFTSREATTDTQGHFRFAGLQPGSYGLSVVIEGQTIDQREGLKAGGEPLELRLPIEIPTAVRVLLPDGSPASDVQVSISVGGSISNPKDRRTDSEGRALFHLRAGWNCTITTTVPGLLPAQEQVTVATDRTTPLEVTLKPKLGLTLEGRVLGHDGLPVPGLSIWILSGKKNEDKPHLLGEDGAFTIRDLSAGYDEVVVSAGTDRRILLHRQSLHVVADTPNRLVVRLPPLGSVSGRLNPVPVIGKKPPTIRAVSVDGPGQGWCELAADGTFSITPLPVGQYRVETQRVRPVYERVMCTVLPGAASDVTFSLPPEGVTVGGHVDWGRVGVGKAHLMLIPDPGHPLTVFENLDIQQRTKHGAIAADGSFSVAGVQPGDWLIMAARERRQWSTSVTVTQAVGDLRLIPEGVEITGVARLATGQPCANAGISLTLRDTCYLRSWVASVHGQTDDQGRFSLGFLRPGGLYDLELWHKADGHSTWGAITATPDMAPLELTVPPQVELRGAWTAPGRDDLQVMAIPRFGRGAHMATIQVDGSWSFIGDNRLTAGAWDLYASATGMAVVSEELELTGDSVRDLVSVVGGSLRVRVTGEPGIDTAGHPLVLIDGSGVVLRRPANPFTYRQLATFTVPPSEAIGSVEIPGLVPGRWRVEVAGAAAEAVVEVGQTATVTVHLTRDPKGR